VEIPSIRRDRGAPDPRGQVHRALPGRAM